MGTTELFVMCQCGLRTAVTAADAGGVVTCGCGERNDVPRLSELREQAGLDAIPLNAAERLRKGVATGELPGARCIECHSNTNHLVWCQVVCERRRTTDPGVNSGDMVHLFGKLLLFLSGTVGWLFGAGRMLSRSAEMKTQGRDTVVDLPLRLCHSCAKSSGNLARSHVLKELAGGLPLFEKLLEEFPDANILFARETDD